MTNSHDYEMPLTAGAQRSVEHAVDLARQENQANVGLRHLLVGLLTDESEAQELLLKSGVSRDSVLQSDLWTQDVPATSDSTTTDDIALAIASDLQSLSYAETSEPTAPQLDIEVETVIARAKGIAAKNKAGEVATDHLLRALVGNPSQAASYLEGFGIGPHVFESPAATAPAPAMPVDFEIEWNSTDQINEANIFRILDASANRAREGLRVVEDYCRFVWDDAFLCEQLKSVRHDFASAIHEMAAESWIGFRDTPEDVGTEISTSNEQQRRSGSDVVAASLKRIEEAFRSLEEYSKLSQPSSTNSLNQSDGSPSRQIEQLRYRVYTIEKAISSRAQNGKQLDDRSLYLLLTQGSCKLPVDEVLLRAIKGGVRIVQIREKAISDRELLKYAKHIREITRQHDVLLIINDRPDLAVLCEADGVHVGQDELSVQACRRIVGAKMLVGVSTHSMTQVRHAILEGADYIGVGPVFESKTKAFDSFAGLDFVREVANETSLPAFAIGGIGLNNVQEVAQAGAHRIAVSNCICGSDSSERDALALHAAIIKG